MFGSAISSIERVNTPMALGNFGEPLSVEAILLFCQSHLNNLDAKIRGAMLRQEKNTAVQDLISRLQAEIPTKIGKEQRLTSEQKASLNAHLDEAMRVASQNGRPDVAKSLADAKELLNRAGDTIVSDDELDQVNRLLAGAQDELRSGNEMAMLRIQSMVSQRATALQLTTNMLNAINEGTKSIAGNIGR